MVFYRFSTVFLGSCVNASYTHTRMATHSHTILTFVFFLFSLPQRLFHHGFFVLTLFAVLFCLPLFLWHLVGLISFVRSSSSWCSCCPFGFGFCCWLPVCYHLRCPCVEKRYHLDTWLDVLLFLLSSFSYLPTFHSFRVFFLLSVGFHFILIMKILIFGWLRFWLYVSFVRFVYLFLDYRLMRSYLVQIHIIAVCFFGFIDENRFFLDSDFSGEWSERLVIGFHTNRFLLQKILVLFWFFPNGF